MENLSLTIRFRHMDRLDPLKRHILSRMETLGNYLDRAVCCDIAVEKAYDADELRAVFNVYLHVSIPGSEIVVIGAAHENNPLEDGYAPVCDACDAALREFENHMWRSAERAQGSARYRLGSARSKSELS
jgi:hypothetical protein